MRFVFCFVCKNVMKPSKRRTGLWIHKCPQAGVVLLSNGRETSNKLSPALLN